MTTLYNFYWEMEQTLIYARRISLLYAAFYNEYYSTIQLLSSNGEDNSLNNEDGTSPLYEACHNGHNSTIE